MQQLISSWKTLVIVLVPLLFSPLVFSIGTKEAKCGYVIIVMALYWMTEALPIAVTALVPVFAFPLLGVLNTNAVSIAYMKETNMMFLGGLIVATSIEHSQLHKRIALAITLLIGQSPVRIAASFMISTMVLSMWISNTASSVMMTPIATAVIFELQKTCRGSKKVQEKIEFEKNKAANDNELSTFSEAEFEKNKAMNENEMGSFTEIAIADDEERHQSVKLDEYFSSIRTMLFLSVAYGANLGGTGSITGSPANLVLRDNLKGYFSEETDLNFASWLFFNVPTMLICGICTFLWLKIFCFGFRDRFKSISSVNSEKAIRKIIEREYQLLGPMTFHEGVVLFFFVMLVLLWFFLSPGFIPGWNRWFQLLYGDFVDIGDSTPAIFIAFLLFCVPAKPKWLRKDNRDNFESPACLTWNVVHEKTPWNIVLLLGGGFAMAKAANESGLSPWLGDQLKSLTFLSAEVLAFLVSIATSTFTEVASNTATASVLLPVLTQLSLSLCINPLMLMLPATLSCSYAFMLPVATPPNAIVYGASKMKTITMVKAGFVANILCVLILTFMINTYGILVFDIKNMPTWSNSSISGTLQC